MKYNIKLFILFLSGIFPLKLFIACKPLIFFLKYIRMHSERMYVVYADSSHAEQVKKVNPIWWSGMRVKGLSNGHILDLGSAL